MIGLVQVSLFDMAFKGLDAERVIKMEIITKSSLETMINIQNTDHLNFD